MLVLAMGFALRLPLLTADTRISSDLASFREWSRGIASRGVAAAYADERIDYPPGSVLLFGALGCAERRAPAPLAGDDRLLNGCIKLIAALADVATASLIAGWFRRRGSRLAVAAAAVYVFNPAIWYVSAYWGQIDSLYTLFLVCAVVALDARAPDKAGAAYAFSLSTKLTGISLAPLVAVWTLVRLGWRGALKAAAAFAAGVALLASPWVFAGRAGDIVKMLTELPGEPPRAAVSAYNLWYLILGGRVHGVGPEVRPPGLPLGIRPLAFALLAVLGAVVLVLALRAGRSPALAAACLALGLFVLSVQMHERYMFPALALLLLACADAQGRLVPACFAALSLTFLYNLVTIATFAPWLGINLIVAPGSPRTSLLRALALGAAFVNVLVLGALTFALARSARKTTS
jgi:dolichyl-phosphate-mannose-protein mannosyltransferase